MLQVHSHCSVLSATDPRGGFNRFFRFFRPLLQLLPGPGTATKDSGTTMTQRTTRAGTYACAGRLHAMLPLAVKDVTYLGVPSGEDPATHGHWCTFTDLYHTIPYRIPLGSAWFRHFPISSFISCVGVRRCVSKAPWRTVTPTVRLCIQLPCVFSSVPGMMKTGTMTTVCCTPTVKIRVIKPSVHCGWTTSGL